MRAKASRGFVKMIERMRNNKFSSWNKINHRYSVNYLQSSLQVPSQALPSEHGGGAGHSVVGPAVTRH